MTVALLYFCPESAKLLQNPTLWPPSPLSDSTKRLRITLRSGSVRLAAPTVVGAAPAVISIGHGTGAAEAAAHMDQLQIDICDLMRGAVREVAFRARRRDSKKALSCSQEVRACNALSVLDR